MLRDGIALGAWDVACERTWWDCEYVRPLVGTKCERSIALVTVGFVKSKVGRPGCEQVAAMMGLGL